MNTFLDRALAVLAQIESIPDDGIVSINISGTWVSEPHSFGRSASATNGTAEDGGVAVWGTGPGEWSSDPLSRTVAVAPTMMMTPTRAANNLTRWFLFTVAPNPARDSRVVGAEPMSTAPVKAAVAASTNARQLG